jgi:hypothetical protein
MGLFSKDKKLKFKLIPSTPEQTQARNYLVGLMDQDIQFPTEQVAPLTGTEQQIQGSLPSYLNQIAEDFDTTRGYYNDVLSGGYDPSTSDYYQGFRAEQNRLKQDALLGIARQGQMAGMSRSTPVLGVQARTGAAIDDATLRQLGLLYENERARRDQAAGFLSQLGGQELSQVGQVEQLAAIQRQQEQMKLSAMYQAALQTLLAPYQYNAQIAGALLSEQRYAGYTTGGGLTDLGFMISAASNAISGGGWPSFGGGGGGGGLYGGTNTSPGFNSPTPSGNMYA